MIKSLPQVTSSPNARNFVVHPKDKVKDKEKTELIYRVPFKNCSNSYVGETGRKFSLRIKEHKKEVDFHSWYTDPSLQGKGEQCNSQVSHHRHAMEENHVIDWDKAKVVDREAQQQTRWIKEAFRIRKTPMCMNWDAGSYQLSHTWDQVISRSYAPLSCKQSRRDQDVKMFLHYASRLLCMFGKYLYRRLSSRMTYLDYTGWMKFNGANAVSFVVVKHVLENSDNFWKVE